MFSAIIQGGANTNPRGGEPHIKDRESQLLRGGVHPKGGRKHPLAPPPPPKKNRVVL